MHRRRRLPGLDRSRADADRVLLGQNTVRSRRLGRDRRQLHLRRPGDRASGAAALCEVDDGRCRLRPVSDLLRLSGQIEDLAACLLRESPQAVGSGAEALGIGGRQRLVEKEGQRGPPPLRFQRKGDANREEQLHPSAARELRQGSPPAFRGADLACADAVRADLEVELVPRETREPVLGPAEDGGAARADVLGLDLFDQEGSGIGTHRFVVAPAQGVLGILAPGPRVFEDALVHGSIDEAPDPRDLVREVTRSRRLLAQARQPSIELRLVVLLDRGEKVEALAEPGPQQVFRPTHLGELPVERPPFLDVPEAAAKLRLLAGRESSAPVQRLDGLFPRPDLAEAPIPALARRADVSPGFVAPPRPVRESIKALNERRGPRRVERAVHAALGLSVGPGRIASGAVFGEE